MSLPTPPDPTPRTGPLGPVVQDKPAPSPTESVHVRDHIWRKPDGKLETKNYSADLPLKGQL